MSQRLAGPGSPILLKEWTPSASRRRPYSGSSAGSTAAIRWLVVGFHSGNSMPVAFRIRLRPPSHPTRYSTRNDRPSDSSTSTPASYCATHTSTTTHALRHSHLRRSWLRPELCGTTGGLLQAPGALYIGGGEGGHQDRVRRRQGGPLRALDGRPGGAGQGARRREQFHHQRLRRPGARCTRLTCS